MIIRKLLRNRGLGVNLIAGFSFLFLAVYGWGLSWKDMGSYLLAILVFLVCLISLAAVCGWLLRKLMGRRDDDSQPYDEDESELPQPKDSDTKPESK